MKFLLNLGVRTDGDGISFLHENHRIFSKVFLLCFRTPPGDAAPYMDGDDVTRIGADFNGAEVNVHDQRAARRAAWNVLFVCSSVAASAAQEVKANTSNVSFMMLNGSFVCKQGQAQQDALTTNTQTPVKSFKFFAAR